MNIKQMRYFLGILEAGSFSKAAESLGVAQPALGLQVQKMENELGVSLLVRHSRGVIPTEAGDVLAKHAVDIVAEAERIRRDIMKMGRKRERMEIPSYPIQPWIPKVCRSWES